MYDTDAEQTMRDVAARHEKLAQRVEHGSGAAGMLEKVLTLLSVPDHHCSEIGLGAALARVPVGTCQPVGQRPGNACARLLRVSGCE